jgi:hypothetical protein
VYCYVSLHARSIQALLSAPNPDDPLADAVAQHWKSDEPAAIRTGARGTDSCLDCTFVGLARTYVYAVYDSMFDEILQTIPCTVGLLVVLQVIKYSLGTSHCPYAKN